MGADFLLFAVPDCKLTEERTKILQGMIDALPNEELDPSGRDEDEGTVRDRLRSALKWLTDAEGLHEVGSYHWDCMSYPMIFSGGESWGDYPTDACAELLTIGNCDMLWNKLAEWAKQDANGKQ